MKKQVLCSVCGQRPAGFRYKGKYKRDKHHDICQQCYRSQINSNYSKIIKGIDSKKSIPENVAVN